MNDAKAWDWVRLGDVAVQVSNYENGTPAESTRLLKLDHVEPLSPWIEAFDAYTPETTFTKRFTAGQLLFPKRNVYLRRAGVTDFDGICSGDFIVIETRNRDRMLPELLPYLAHTEGFFKHAMRTSAGSMSKRTKWKDLAEYEFALPPLARQAEIVELLGAVEANRGALRRLSTVVDTLVEAVVADRFEVMARGDTVMLTDAASVERGKFTHRPRNDPRFYGGPYPFIQTGDIKASGGLINSYRQTLNEEGLGVSRLFPRGTVVVTIAANIGDSAILEFDSCFPDSVVGIIPSDGYTSEFIELFMRHQRRELDRAAPSSTQKNINLTALRELRIPAVAPVDQMQTVSEVAGIASLGDDVRERLDQLTCLRTALLHTLLEPESGGTADAVQ